MRLLCPILILNPFDERGVAWDISKDITTPAAARQLSVILIPEEKNVSQPFFPNAARDIVTSVVLVLMKRKPGAWTLRDVVLAVQTRNSLITLLEQTPETAVKVDLYFADDRTGSNILSELATRMAPFEFVAAAWSNAQSKVSLKEWVDSETVLVLGNNEEHRAALDPINRVIFQRVTELILSQSESSTRRTWLFLDEIREAGNLESLGRLMTKGRSKGASVVLGFQDIEGMQDAFGKERANEIIGQCANKAVLRLNSPETAEWASKLFGKYEFFEDETGQNAGGSKATGKTTTEGESSGTTETKGTSHGTSKGSSYGKSDTSGSSGGHYSGSSTSSRQDSEQTTEQTSESTATQKTQQTSKADTETDTESWTKTVNRKRMEKDSIMPSEIMGMPVTTPRNGLHGYFLLPSIGAFYGVLDGMTIKNSLMPPDRSQENYVERPASEQYLTPWSEAEKQTLGLAVTVSNVASPQPPAGGVPASAAMTDATADGDTEIVAARTAPLRNVRVQTVPQADAADVARLQAFLDGGM